MTTATLERPMTTGPAAKTLMDLAEEIAPIVRREADAIEAAGHLTPAVIDAIVERDLFQVLLMGARGIRDVTLTDACDFLRRVAMADGSTSWDLLAAMGGNLISGFLPEEAASRVYASRADAMATAVGSVGKAIAVEGGYLVEAKWPFLSGSSHATWLGGLCMVYDGDAPRMMPDGSPYLVVPLVRKERATVLDSWHSLGLRGTASHDAIVSGVFVPEAETADFARGPREELPLLFSIDENAAAPLAAASVALGIARGAVEAYREL